jgi:hypothetical protein
MIRASFSILPGGGGCLFRFYNSMAIGDSFLLGFVAVRATL